MTQVCGFLPFLLDFFSFLDADVERGASSGDTGYAGIDDAALNAGDHWP